MSDATTPAPAAPASSSSANNDNVMAAVATIPLVGLIIYFAMNDASALVKHYAKQSIGLFIISIILGVANAVIAFLPYGLWAILSCISGLFGLALFVLWIVLLVSALQGKTMRIPVMSDLLDQFIK